MEIVYPVTDATLTLANGSVFVVRRGQHWSTEDAVVKEKPDAFSADPRYGLAFSAPPPEMADPPVEQATAEPGEKRSIRRG
jgi:hypothetical protein